MDYGTRIYDFILKWPAVTCYSFAATSRCCFYDYEAKYQRNDVEYGIPCGLSESEEKNLQALCLRAFQAVGAEGWGRIDAMQDEQGNFWLLEVNTVLKV